MMQPVVTSNSDPRTNGSVRGDLPHKDAGAHARGQTFASALDDSHVVAAKGGKTALSNNDREGQVTEDTVLSSSATAADASDGQQSKDDVLSDLGAAASEKSNNSPEKEYPDDESIAWLAEILAPAVAVTEVGQMSAADTKAVAPSEEVPSTGEPIVTQLVERISNHEANIDVDGMVVIDGAADTEPENSEFDWLSMLDDIHAVAAVNSGNDQAEDSTSKEPSIDTDSHSLQVQAANLGTDLLVAEIMRTVELLREQGDDVDPEALADLNILIDDLLTQDPNMKPSSMLGLSGDDWKNMDARLLRQMLLNVNSTSSATTPLVETASDELLHELVKADDKTIAKVAEQAAAQMLEKEPATSKVKENFVEKLKSDIAEAKISLRNGQGESVDFRQMVREALPDEGATGLPQQVENSKLQQLVTTTRMTLEGQASESRVGIAAETNKTSVASTSKGGASELDINRQNLANNLDKAVNLNRPDAPQNIAEKVQLMVNSKTMTAEIRLDPQDLGSMKLKINAAGDAVSVNIVVQSQQAREVLEQATPRLRELLEEQGIELGQSSVKQESQQHSANDGERRGMAKGGSDQDAELDNEHANIREVAVVNGAMSGIDFFV